MAKIHEKYLITLFLNDQIVLTGSELSERICNQFPNCTKENSRKIIQNAVNKKIIHSSKPLTFGNNQYAYYGYNCKLSKEMIHELMKKSRKSIYRVIQRFNQNGGIISYVEIFKISASIVEKGTTKVNTINEIISILENMKLVKKASNNGVKYLVENDVEECIKIQLMQDHHNKLLLDCIFIPSFLFWLQKHNLIDNNKIVYRDKKNIGKGVVHNNIVWDAYAYTSTTGFSEYISIDKKEKQTLVVLDFKIRDTYDSLDLSGFYNRIQIHRNSVKDKNNKRKILPIVVANKIDIQTKKELNNLKILSFDLGTVFGERIYEIISKFQMISAQKMIEFDSIDSTQYITDILVALKESGQDGNLGNLKGELFECLMYKVLHKICGKNLYSIKSSYRFQGYEYDYLVETESEYIIFELKGYKASTFIKKGEFDKKTQKPTPHTIKWFFGYTYPPIKRHLENNPFNKPVKSCYITTAKFSEDATEELLKLNDSRCKPSDLNVSYDGTELVKLLKEHGLNNEVEVIIRYYGSKKEKA